MKKEKNEETNIEDDEICEKCGEKLIEEDGMSFCPKCDGEIDFFGDSDN